MPALAVIDVRPIAPHERHALVFDALQALAAGDTFELHNDHDPVPLQRQVMLQWPGQFDWQALEAGPTQWRIRITRREEAKSCCGRCGG